MQRHFDDIFESASGISNEQSALTLCGANSLSLTAMYLDVD